jgi:hypothetical protein
VPASTTAAWQTYGWTLEQDNDISLFQTQNAYGTRLGIYLCATQATTRYGTNTYYFLDDSQSCSGYGVPDGLVGYADPSPVAPGSLQIQRLASWNTDDSYFTTSSSWAATLEASWGYSANGNIGASCPY